MFSKQKAETPSVGGRLEDFSFLGDDNVYMDTACQSVRPQPVTDRLMEYYHEFNACGGRVKYKWGQQVDEAVETTRQRVLGLLSLSAKDYSVSFTLNTTYGLNLLMSQLPAEFDKIVTSDIEHNSVFLPAIDTANRLGVTRVLLERADDGALEYSQNDLENAVVIVNTTSNIDGRNLTNVKKLVDDTHNRGGIVILDAAQTMAHEYPLLVGTKADAICFSAHKLYGASLGCVVIHKDLLDRLSHSFIGGGMVSDVEQDSYTLTPDDLSSRLEPGLQSFGEIIALGTALEWLQTVKPGGKTAQEHIKQLSQQLFDELSAIPQLEMFNKTASPVVSLHSKKHEAHRLAVFLSASNIMVRSGYFCCHYYLQKKLQSPPLVRFSIGLHTTQDDIATVVSTMRKLHGGA